jgi:hypothetical protein
LLIPDLGDDFLKRKWSFRGEKKAVVRPVRARIAKKIRQIGELATNSRSKVDCATLGALSAVVSSRMKSTMKRWSQKFNLR